MDPEILALVGLLAGGLGALGGAKGVRALDARKARKEKEFYDYIADQARKKGFRPPLNPVDQAVEAKNLIIQGKDKEIEELTHKLKMMQDTTKGMKDNLNIAGNGVNMFKDVAEQNKSLNDSLTKAREEISKLQGVSADNKSLQESLAKARNELSQLQGVAENNKTLQETINTMKDSLKRMEMEQSNYKGLGNAAKNFGSEMLTFAKNNKGLTAGIGLGAAGLATLPFLFGGSSNKEASLRVIKISELNEDRISDDITHATIDKIASSNMEKTAGGALEATLGGLGGALSGLVSGAGLGAAGTFTRRSLFDEDTPMMTDYGRNMLSTALPMALASGLVGAAQGYMMPNLSKLFDMNQFANIVSGAVK